MIVYFLVLTFSSGYSTDSPLPPAVIPQTYQSLPACKAAGETAMGQYSGKGDVGGYTCVPWNSEGD